MIADLKVGDKVRKRRGLSAVLVSQDDIGEIVWIDGRHVRVCWDLANQHYWEYSDELELAGES